MPEVGEQCCAKPQRVAGQGRKPGERDLSGGVGEQQARHQDLAGEVVVAGASGAQDQPTTSRSALSWA